MPEMSGKCKSNPTKTNILTYIVPPGTRPALVVTKKCSNGSVVWRLVDTDRQTNKRNIYNENQKTIERRH